MEVNAGAPPDHNALRFLNDVADDAKLVVRFDQECGSMLVPATTGIDAALGKILAIVFAAKTDGTWDRLKACAKDTCRFAFYDHSKNHSSHWCSMAVCGNRTKVKGFRDRRQAASAAS
jgi:predicted RNA-binding Zn ribbon-like protein